MFDLVFRARRINTQQQGRRVSAMGERPKLARCLRGRILVVADAIHVVDVQFRLRQAVTKREFWNARIMLDAREAFLLHGC